MKRCDYKLVEFCSNPPLPDKPQVIPGENSVGNITNVISYVPNSHHSFFEGIVYSPDTMSLRAKMNLGVRLTPVPALNLDNDPLEVQARALRIEHDIQSRLSELDNEQVLSSSEPTNVES